MFLYASGLRAQIRVCRGEGVTPPQKKYCLKVSSKNNCGTTTVINRNFLLKYNKFAKILAEFNAQITGNGLYSALDFKTLPGENSTGRPIKHDYVYSESSVPCTITTVHN